MDTTVHANTVLALYMETPVRLENYIAVIVKMFPRSFIDYIVI